MFVDSEEFTNWQAYYRMDLFAEDRIEFTLATAAAYFANCQRSQNVDRLKPSDFMIDNKPREAEAKPADVDAQIDDGFTALQQYETVKREDSI